MKRCPKCGFGFVNFHHVCDFDGTDLVDDPETLPVSPGISALVAATQSRFLRLVKSPVFLIVLAVAGLVSSALVIGYYDAASQPNLITESPALLDSKDSPDSIVSLVPPAQLPARLSARSSVQIATRAPSPSPNGVSTPTRLSSDRVTSRSELTKSAKDQTRGRSITASRTRALHPSPSLRHQPSQPELALQRQPKDKTLQLESKDSALQRDSKENAHRKESKLTTAMKTTWNILKKPFKF